MTATTSRPDSVAALLAECSPQCLLSAESTRCACRCGGEHHAALADAIAQLRRTDEKAEAS